MTRRVYKYYLHPGHVPLGWDLTVEMPDGAEIVHVEGGTEDITIWARVETDRPLVKRLFAVLATGQDIPDNAVHIVTWLDAPFVWHLFEVVQ